MIGLLRSNRERIPFIGDILFSILVFPFASSFMERWVVDRSDPGLSVWVCAMYVTLGLVHLFRAFRLRGRSHSAFVAHLVYCAAFAACGALAAVLGLTETTMWVLSLTFWGCTMLERVLDIVRNRKLWRIILNVLALLLLLFLSLTIADKDYSMIFVGMIALAASLLSIMILIFSQIRVHILKEIIRKTYAVEIISGLLLMIITFSNVLVFTDDAFRSFWDALWYCFAVVTTIGFGDLTPVSGTGRLLTVILGAYGIVVVALITSIIVNFYGEMKRATSSETKEVEDHGKE